MNNVEKYSKIKECLDDAVLDEPMKEFLKFFYEIHQDLDKAKELTIDAVVWISTVPDLESVTFKED